MLLACIYMAFGFGAGQVAIYWHGHDECQRWQVPIIRLDTHKMQCAERYKLWRSW